MIMTPPDVYQVLMDAGFTPADCFDGRDGREETFYGGRGDAVRVSLFGDDERAEIHGLTGHGVTAWDLKISLAVPQVIFAAALAGAVAHWPCAAEHDTRRVSGGRRHP